MIDVKRFQQAESLMIGSLVAAVIAGAAAWYLPEAQRRADAFSRPAQAITLRELAASGFGDDPNVLLTDFACGEGAVIQQRTRQRWEAAPAGSDDSGSFKAWIPLFPKPLHGGEPGGFTVLLESSEKLTTPRGLMILSRRPRMEALASRVTDWNLPLDVRVRLSQSYPDTDFTSCLLLQEYQPHEVDDARPFAIILTVATVAVLIASVTMLGLGVYSFSTRRKGRVEVGPDHWEGK